jgi:hypothetical protein
MSFQPWGNPDPQSIAGLNSAMGYGENLQFTTGLNHQVALGSNLQLCVNPSVLFEMLNVPGSSTLSSLFGSGLGGNMQFTIGSSTNINWGRQFQINLGPEQITIDANQHKAFATAMCGMIGAVCIAHSIGYGICTDEDRRATLVIAFQVAIDLLLAAFTAQMMHYKGIESGLTDGVRKLVGAGSDSPPHALGL